MAAFLAATAAVHLLPPDLLAPGTMAFLDYQEELLFALLVEGAFLLMQGTLIDIATRLRKRPPVWAGVVIVAGVAVFSNEALALLRMAWDQGLVVFVPLVVSLADRGRVLWTMPDRSRVEKLAARALIANRITTGLVLFGLVTVLMMIGVIFHSWDWNLLGAWPALAAGAVYFAIAAYDGWRVRGARFAEHPRTLFRWDPIGVQYLEPL